MSAPTDRDRASEAIYNIANRRRLNGAIEDSVDYLADTLAEVRAEGAAAERARILTMGRKSIAVAMQDAEYSGSEEWMLAVFVAAIEAGEHESEWGDGKLLLISKPAPKRTSKRKEPR